MIIYFLDENPHTAGVYHSNFHIAKYIEIYMEMLNGYVEDNALLNLQPNGGIDTVVDTVATQWLHKSHNNVAWFIELMNTVVTEYHKRFKRVHVITDSFIKMRDAINMAWLKNEIQPDYTEHTHFPVTIPDMYITFENPVDCYRYYYVQAKKHHTKHYKVKPEFFESPIYTNKVNGFEANSALAKMVAKYKDRSIGKAEKETILGFIKREAEKLGKPLEHVLYARYEQRSDRYYTWSNDSDQQLFSSIVNHLFGDIPIYLVRSGNTGRKVQQYRLWLTDTEHAKFESMYSFHKAKIKMEREKLLANLTIAYLSKQKIRNRPDLDFDYSNEYDQKTGKEIENNKSKYDSWSAMNLANQMDFHIFVDGIDNKEDE